MIKVQNISKSFGNNPAVKDISFEVEKGENFILLGTSGCGKTTTLRLINRLIEPTSGTIEINGKNIHSLQPENLRRTIGYVLQRNSLFPHYTIAENIAVVPKLLKWDKIKIAEKTKQLLHKFHLPEERLSAYPNELSGGEAQRVNLARAIIANPELLLMDEPFGALDPVTRVSIRKEFKELEAFKKKTILMVTHDIQEAFELGNKICLMDKGEIMQIGTAKELLFKPKNDFVKTFFLDAHFQLSLTITTLQDIWIFIPQKDSNSHIQKILFSANTSLWKVIETLTNTNKKDSFFHIQLENEDVKNQMTFEDLMTAFNHYKNKI